MLSSHPHISIARVCSCFCLLIKAIDICFTLGKTQEASSDDNLKPDFAGANKVLGADDVLADVCDWIVGL